MELQEKVVVITGASRGLGRALAFAFSKEGARLVLANRREDELNAVASETGGIAVVTDVSDEAQVHALAQQAVEKYGSIDIWINNAGIWMPHAPVEEMDWVRVHNLFEVNVFGTMYGSKEALVQMRKQNTGIIINISSTSGVEGSKNSSGYSASKFAVSGFTQSLGKEVEGTGIRIFCIYPGGMKTHLFDEVTREGYDTYMDANDVAKKIVDHIKDETADADFIIKRPQHV